jgi:hypothetical protein
MFNCEVPGLPGHRIQSIVVDEGVDPVTKQKVYEYQILCIQCGRTLEEVRAGAKQTRGPRKKKLEVTQIAKPPENVSEIPVNQAPSEVNID